jgi:hypothetical protein
MGRMEILMNELVYHNKILSEEDAYNKMKRFVEQISEIDTDKLDLAQTRPLIPPDSLSMNRISEEVTQGRRKVSDADSMIQAMMAPIQP